MFSTLTTSYSSTLLRGAFEFIDFFNEKEANLLRFKNLHKQWFPFNIKIISIIHTPRFTCKPSNLPVFTVCLIFRHRRMSNNITKTLPLRGSWRALWCKLCQPRSWLQVHLRTRISAPKWWNHL